MKLCKLEVLASKQDSDDFYVFEETENAHSRFLFVLRTDTDNNSFTKIKFAEAEKDSFEALKEIKEGLIRELRREGFKTLSSQEGEDFLLTYPNILKALVLSTRDTEKQEEQPPDNYTLYRKIKI